MVLGCLLHSKHSKFRLQGYHLLWRTFPSASAIRIPKTGLRNQAPSGSRNPLMTTRFGYHVTKVWAVARSLAATRAISVDFYSRGY